MASRTVMNESAKWRSGRSVERTSGTGPSGRGGKRPSEDGQDESVTGKDHSYVVLPSGIGSTFEVIETEFPFHVLVCALCPPSLFGKTYELAQ